MNAQNSEERWDTYMATYEDGKSGSTTLRMDLIDYTPIESYDNVLVTGLTYETSKENGFPENETFSLLHKVADELIEIVEGETEFILLCPLFLDGLGFCIFIINILAVLRAFK